MREAEKEFVIVVKRGCPTCTLIAPVLEALVSDPGIEILSQDDPGFPSGDAVDDTELARSHALEIEIVPALIRYRDGAEVERFYGWDRDRWRALLGRETLGADLPAIRPGCGALNREPAASERLEQRFGAPLSAREIAIGAAEDPWEACYERGWSDGLPVVPPTPPRVRRMLAGTERAPDEMVATIPPNGVACTVEKVAVNAVMAGCLPEYMPVLLTAVEAACEDAFCLHGLVATTWYSGPVLVVSGPIARRIGMNAGINALGQGNRANSTIGRALQLIVRNVGGGRPGEIDRATLGQPGKHGFCFAEDVDAPWTSLSETRGFAPGTSTVTVFGGDGVQGILDQQSREPESLARSFASCLQTVCHPKIVMAADAILVVSPEHVRVFAEAGWSKETLASALDQLTRRPDKVLIRGTGGMAEGIPGEAGNRVIPKFRPGGLHIVCAGGPAGLFSAIIGGWPASGTKGSEPVTKEIPS